MPESWFPSSWLLEWLQAVAILGVLCFIAGISTRGVVRFVLWSIVAGFTVSPCLNYWLFDPQWHGLWPSFIYTKAMVVGDWPGIEWLAYTITPVPTFAVCFLGLFGFNRGWFSPSANHTPYNEPPPLT